MPARSARRPISPGLQAGAVRGRRPCAGGAPLDAGRPVSRDRSQNREDPDSRSIPPDPPWNRIRPWPSFEVRDDPRARPGGLGRGSPPRRRRRASAPRLRSVPRERRSADPGGGTDQALPFFGLWRSGALRPATRGKSRGCQAIQSRPSERPRRSSPAPGGRWVPLGVRASRGRARSARPAASDEPEVRRSPCRTRTGLGPPDATRGYPHPNRAGVRRGSCCGGRCRARWHPGRSGAARAPDA
jgi:hypothetical protein